MVAASAALASGPVREAVACWYDPIIFDPQALVEHVLHVAQLVQQVETAAQQVKNQISGLAHLNAGVAPDITLMVAGVQGQLDAALYDTANPGGQLDARFPANMVQATGSQFEADQTKWTGLERQSLAENRQLQNQIVRDMNPTREQVQSIVEASNSAPGETAAGQAHNDLLAVASGELAKLQSLKAARSRLKTERLAREQSELSYASAEAERVGGRGGAGGDNPTPPTGGVIVPFQN
jgi:P-type conjugative transfer protein TrbJ